MNILFDNSKSYKKKFKSHSLNNNNISYIKKNKSLNSNTIDNKSSKIHKFFTSGDKYKDFELTYIPYKTYLYQGTDFNFENDKKTVEDFYDYYNQRNYGAYFVSTYKIASRYGIKRDFTNILYTTAPSKEDIIEPKYPREYDYIYPLYYIKGYNGVNIKYTLNKNLILLDIGNLKNIILLWQMILETKDPIQIKKGVDILYETVCTKDTNEYDQYKNPPYKALRTSLYTDNDLVLLFQTLFVKIFKSRYNIDIDGWIYTDIEFHDEILLINNESLVYNTKTKLPLNLYKGIPTLEEFKKSMSNKKINIDNILHKNQILTNL